MAKQQRKRRARSNQIDRIPNDEIGEKIHVILVEKQKANERAAESKFIELSKYRIIELSK